MREDMEHMRFDEEPTTKKMLVTIFFSGTVDVEIVGNLDDEDELEERLASAWINLTDKNIREAALCDEWWRKSQPRPRSH